MSDSIRESSRCECRGPLYTTAAENPIPIARFPDASENGRVLRNSFRILVTRSDPMTFNAAPYPYRSMRRPGMPVE